MRLPTKKLSIIFAISLLFLLTVQIANANYVTHDLVWASDFSQDINNQIVVDQGPYYIDSPNYNSTSSSLANGVYQRDFSVNDYSRIVVPYNPVLYGTHESGAPFTAQVWANIINTTAPSAQQIMRLKNDGGGLYEGWILRMSGNSLYIHLNSNSYSTSYTTYKNSYHLLTYVYDGANMKLYIDTTKILDQNVGLVNWNTNYPLSIGGYSGTSLKNSVNGTLALPRYYSTALTEEEITQNYNMGYALNVPSPIIALQNEINTNAGISETVVTQNINGGLNGHYLTIPSATILDGDNYVFNNVSIVISNVDNVVISDVINNGSRYSNYHRFSCFNISDTCINITLNNCVANNSRVMASPFRLNNPIGMRDITLNGCRVGDTDIYGFDINCTNNESMTGYYSVTNYRVLNCIAEYVGYYDDRLDQTNVGFCLGNIDTDPPLYVIDAVVDNCTSSYCYVSGFYCDAGIYTQNCTIMNSVSINNGIRGLNGDNYPGPGFGINSPINLINDTSINCHTGFSLFTNGRPVQASINVQDCREFNSSNIGFMFWEYSSPMAEDFIHTIVNVIDSASNKAGSFNKTFNFPAKSVYGDAALYTAYARNLRINNFTVRDPKGNGDIVINITHSQDSSFDLNYIGINGSVSALRVIDSDNLTISGDIDHDNTTAIMVNSSSDIKINNTNICGGTEYAIIVNGVDNTKTVTVDNCLINDTYGEYTNAAIYFDGLGGGETVVYVDTVNVPNEPRSDGPITFTCHTPQVMTITTPVSSIVESNTIITLTINKTGGINYWFPCAVNVNTTDGTALASSDYEALNEILSLNNMSDDTATVVLSIKDNGLGTFPKTFTVVLSDPTGNATLGEPSDLTITINEQSAATGIFGPLVLLIAALIGLIPSVVNLIVYVGILMIVTVLAGGLFTLINTIKNRF
jgi:hypothetical protein